MIFFYIFFVCALKNICITYLKDLNRCCHIISGIPYPTNEFRIWNKGGCVVSGLIVATLHINIPCIVIRALYFYRSLHKLQFDTYLLIRHNKAYITFSILDIALLKDKLVQINIISTELTYIYIL